MWATLKTKLSQQQVSESFILASLLAFVGGYLDAYTYFCRGHVFANAQTGNIILMGLNLANGKWLDSLYYFLPIIAFIVGVVISEIIRHKYKEHPNIHWRQIILLVEVVIVLGVAFIPIGRWNMGVNILVSFICSMQVESFRKVNGNTYASTMCTGNLRSASELLYKGIFKHDLEARKHSRDYFIIILLFIVGAVISMYLSRYLGAKSIALCSLVLGAAFLIMFIDHKHKITR